MADKDVASLDNLTPVMQTERMPACYEVTTSSENGGRSGYKAFDRVHTSSNIWHSNANMPQWIQMRFPRSCEVRKFSIKNPPADQYGAAGIINFELQGSNNGSSYTTLGSYANDPNNDLVNEFTVEKPGKYRYYRIYVTSSGYEYNGTPYCQISEIQFYGVNEPIALPSGYRPLRYIKGDGNAWLDTEVKATAKTTAKYKYLTNKILTYGPHVLTGTSWYFPMVRGYSAGTFVVNRGGNEIGSAAISPQAGVIYEVDAHFVNNKVTVNGAEYGSYPMGSVSADTTSLHLFTPGVAPGDGQFSLDGQMWYCQIDEDGVLIRDYVPVENASGEVGMYDLVNGVFRTSDGSSGFTAGPYITGPVEGNGVSILAGVSFAIKEGTAMMNGVARKITEGMTILGGVAKKIAVARGIDVAAMVIGYTGAYTDQKDVTMSGKKYRLLTLTGSGTLTIPKEVHADVWMCSGGTSGNDGSIGIASYSGGGGAGGFAKQFSSILAAGDHVAVVGSGGATATVNTQTGFNAGTHSAFVGQETTGTFSVNTTYRYHGTSGGTGGGGAGSSGGKGDGVQKIPFGDSSFFANAHCAGGGGGGTRNGSTYRKGGEGGTNGGNGLAGSTGDYGGGAGGSYGGGKGGAGYGSTRDGAAATYYGSGGGGGGSYNGSEHGTGGAGYQGVIYVRIPYEQQGG